MNSFWKINILRFAEFPEAMFSIWKIFSLGEKIGNIKEDAQEPKKGWFSKQYTGISTVALGPKINQFYSRPNIWCFIFHP